MIVTYFRSSSLGSWSMCPLVYYAEYSLGRRSPTGKMALLGTVGHKCYEILAKAKLAEQNGEPDFYDDVIGGKVKNKISDKYIPALVERIYKYYTSHNPHIHFVNSDLTSIKRWVKQGLEMSGGLMDPRNQTIYQPELPFDIVIDKPWADYEYEHNGTKIKGKLGVKGTTDLILRDPKIPGYYEIVDYKFGRRLNWATGEIKDAALLQKDTQLKLYYYAAMKLIPDAKQISVTIFFVKDGGPFTLCFGPKDIEDVENTLKERFNEIRACKNPPLRIGKNCTSFCHYGKTTFEGSDIEPLIMTEDGHVTPKGRIASKCEQIHHDIQVYGIDATDKKYRKPGYDPNFYQSPGSV